MAGAIEIIAEIHLTELLFYSENTVLIKGLKGI